jgi:hypothetical protein
MGGEEAGEDGRVRGKRQRNGRDRGIEPDARGGQPVQIRRFGRRVPVGTDVIGPDGVDRDEEQVRMLRPRALPAGAEEKERRRKQGDPVGMAGEGTGRSAAS